ncbi:reverse transcriptase domain-containing protein [Tanacetum coccineum]
MIIKAELNNDEPWYADYINYIVGKIIPPNWTPEKRRRFFSQVKYYFWGDPYAFKLCSDNVIRRCLAGNEIFEILAHCHSGPTRGHHSASITGRKVYESGFFWPSIFKDAKDYVMKCDACQRSGNISSRSEMPQNNIQALQQCNINLTTAAKSCFMELNVLMELRDGAYEKTRIYKERTKKWHNSRLRGDKDFRILDKVLLFNSRFKMHPGKLKSKWYGPNVVKTVYPYGTVEITDKNGISFKVNGQRLKKYYDGHIDTGDKEVVEFEKNTT